MEHQINSEFNSSFGCSACSTSNIGYLYDYGFDNDLKLFYRSGCPEILGSKTTKERCTDGKYLYKEEEKIHWKE